MCMLAPLRSVTRIPPILRAQLPESHTGPEGLRVMASRSQFEHLERAVNEIGRGRHDFEQVKSSPVAHSTLGLFQQDAKSTHSIRSIRSDLDGEAAQLIGRTIGVTDGLTATPGVHNARWLAPTGVLRSGKTI